MINGRNPNLLDLIAVLSPPVDSDLQPGDVGTVVELLPPDGVEAEFLDKDGHTLYIATLTFSDVLVLNRERPRVA